MKNILIISSSPRKAGNSQLLCEQFKAGAEASGHKVTLVRLAEKQIGFCRACDACMRNGGTCILRDDMHELIEAFQKADVLVLATPVYFYGISSLMKLFIDRIYPICQRQNKKRMDSFESMRSCCIGGCRIASRLRRPVPALSHARRPVKNLRAARA